MDSHVKYSPVVGVRHLQDVDALASYGFNGPLVQDAANGERLERAAERILEVLRASGASNIKLIFSESLSRLRDTALLLAERLRDDVPVELTPEPLLKAFDQGRPVLPPESKDGQNVPAVTTAWDIFCAQSYDRGELDYPSGSAVASGGVYRELDGSFVHPGGPFAASSFANTPSSRIYS